MSGRGQRGVNLIELVIAIVVISVATSGVLLVFTQTIRFSADPMVQQQAASIAEAYLDEILARPVEDPNTGTEVGLGAAEAGEVRATFDDVQDYSTIVAESPPRDQNGAVLAELAAYTVTVVVTPSVSVGPAGEQVPMAQVDVTVAHATQPSLSLRGFRAN